MWKCVDWKKQEMVFSAGYSFLNSMCAFCLNMPIYFPVLFILLYYGNMLIIPPARQENILNNFGERKQSMRSKYLDYLKVKVLVAQLCLILCDPMDCEAQGLLCPWNSPGKNTGVGCHSLLQGIFPSQGSSLGLRHYRQILYCLTHQGSPFGSN